MKFDGDVVAPAKRTTDLVVREQSGEMLVLDTRNDRVHCLPADVTRVWDACTGDRTLDQLAAATGLDLAVVAGSVEQLVDLDLLTPNGVDRRHFLRRTALVGGAAISVPLIQTVLAPSAFAAGCSVNRIQLTAGGQDSCTGNGAHAKYNIKIQGCDPNTRYYATLSYTDGNGVAQVEEVNPPLPRTDASGNLQTTANGYLTNQRLPAGTSTITLRLYSDSAHTVLLAQVDALFTISC